MEVLPITAAVTFLWRLQVRGQRKVSVQGANKLQMNAFVAVVLVFFAPLQDWVLFMLISQYTDDFITLTAYTDRLTQMNPMNLSSSRSVGRPGQMFKLAEKLKWRSGGNSSLTLLPSLKHFLVLNLSYPAPRSVTPWGEIP